MATFSGLSVSKSSSAPDAKHRYQPTGPSRKGRTSYYYDDIVSTIHYGKRHPMKPQRMALCHELVLCYGLYDRLDMYQPRMASEEELKMFHVSDYVDFLRTVTPDNVSAFKDVLSRFNVGDDCPIFNDLYKFCRVSAGGSLAAAAQINRGEADVAINWSGGLHHAKKTEASGFCYVNDIVLCIMELLRCHARVLYIDIDVHHGDGVQEAFYKTDRVMTVSFHRYGPSGDGGSDPFFPGTGAISEIGHDHGRYYSLNVPLKAGMDDTTYVSLFKSIMEQVMHTFRPGAIVLQCGADSLGCDRLGQFCLSIDGHGQCVEYMKSFQVPLVVLGGGGYTIKNVARCWANETALLVNAKLPNAIPPHPYLEYYGPDYKLHPKIHDQLRNENSTHELNNIKRVIAEHLKFLGPAPSTQMHQPPPAIDSLTEDGWAAERDRAMEMQADLEARVRLGVRPGVAGGNRYWDNEWFQDERDQEDGGGEASADTSAMDLDQSRGGSDEDEQEEEEDEDEDDEDDEGEPMDLDTPPPPRVRSGNVLVSMDQLVAKSMDEDCGDAARNK
ncbi:hypothetical protein BCR44DRAFT_1497753 [Catenaria anguillulae PL171]|uniref:Histone deacetylase n=1 Tax=Catenaria anguillulae PL171 TaxID=765915 RepID=A0A1Y2HUS8_9FUNG|nr:hypothetical protein BCR44DRAFT_1497753 [Catenaria anguillulae PL171]